MTDTFLKGNPTASPYTDFDFLNTDCKYYNIEFRIVRFIADDGKFVCVVTNFPKEEFALEEIKKLYNNHFIFSALL